MHNIAWKDMIKFVFKTSDISILLNPNNTVREIIIHDCNSLFVTAQIGLVDGQSISSIS